MVQSAFLFIGYRDWRLIMAICAQQIADWRETPFCARLF
jgi:hypothetical protein